MNENLTWNAIKKQLWKETPEELMQKLQQLVTEKQKMEIYLRFGGSSHRMAYQPSTNKERFKYGNLKELRHRIACIKTMLNVKLNRQNLA